MHLLASCLVTLSFQVSGWEVFEDTQFKWQYAEKLGTSIEVPIFNPELRLKDGSEVQLTGFYLPLELDGGRIVISKLPYASCFFCGGGVGQESVAEVEFSTPQRPFRMDEIITVKGRLKLNQDDYDHLVFILTDAILIQL